ncbi:MAG TPA: LysR family transcriptional regulator [Pseudomonadales bacterium]|nr:LysR family transcriptional regulator [Pseudomonadales bacterium]
MQIERGEVRVFHAVIEAGGFRRAAERLSITQSAVSQAVANLEHKLGTPLIKRTAPPQLTESGLRLMRYAETVLKEEAAALRDLEQIRSGALSTLSLAMSSAVNHAHGRSLMLEFCHRNPFTRLKLDVAPSREIVYGVGEARWEVGFGPFQKRMPGHFTTLECLRETRRLVVAATHPEFAAIRRDPEAALGRATLITSWLDDPGRRPGGARLRDAFGSVWEVGNTDLRLALVAEGRGLAYVSDLLLDGHPAAAGLVPVEGLDLASVQRRVGLYWQTQRPLSEGARRFVQLCRERWPAAPAGSADAATAGDGAG